MHNRKHKVIKRYAEDILNNTVYARSVLTEIILRQLADATGPHSFKARRGLVDPRKAPSQISAFMRAALCVDDVVQIWSSIKAHIHPLSLCTKGDALLIKSIDGSNFVAGQLWFLAHVDNIGTFALISLRSFEEGGAASGWANWRMPGSPCLKKIETILKPVIWTECSPGIARTLVRYELRGLNPVAA